MLHFFPRNYLQRRTIVSCDRKPSHKIHSFGSSKEKEKTLAKEDEVWSSSLNLSDHEGKKKRRSFQIKNNNPDSKKEIDFHAWQKYKDKEEDENTIGNNKRKTLFVKGFCKTPSFQIKISEQNEQNARKIVTSTNMRTRKIVNSMKISHTIEMHERPKQPKLMKRVSRETGMLKGWDFSEDFTDF